MRRFVKLYIDSLGVLQALTDTERSVMLWMGLHTNGDGLCWPSIKTLVEFTGRPERTVIRALHTLVEKRGLLTVARKGGGRGKVNMYRLTNRVFAVGPEDRQLGMFQASRNSDTPSSAQAENSDISYETPHTSRRESLTAPSNGQAEPDTRDSLSSSGKGNPDKQSKTGQETLTSGPENSDIETLSPQAASKAESDTTKTLLARAEQEGGGEQEGGTREGLLEEDLPVALRPQAARRRKPRKPVKGDPRVAQVLGAMGAEFGFPEKTKIDPVPSYGQEGQAIKRMLKRGFTPEEILSFWRGKIKLRGGIFVSMQWVNKDIAKEGDRLFDKSLVRGRGSSRMPARDSPDPQAQGSPPGEHPPWKVVGDAGNSEAEPQLYPERDGGIKQHAAGPIDTERGDT